MDGGDTDGLTYAQHSPSDPEALALHHGLTVVADEALIVAESDIVRDEVAETLTAFGVRVVGEIEGAGIYQLRFENPERDSNTLAQLLGRLERLGSVSSASPHFVYENFALYPDEGYHDGALVDDGDGEKAWSISAIQNQVWGQTVIGLPDLWAIQSGSFKRLVIVDSGFDHQHPDFVDAAGFRFASLELDNGVPSKRQRHGTHVAGIAAAGLDNGLGIAGVDGAVDLELWAATGWASDEPPREVRENWWRRAVTQMSVLDAVSQAMAVEDGSVINVSQGLPWLTGEPRATRTLCTDPAQADAELRLDRALWRPVLRRALETDTLIVAAAGNYGDISDPGCRDTVRFSGALQDPEPEFADSVLVVASVGGGARSRADFLAGPGLYSDWRDDWSAASPFTSFGASVDVAAPGAQIMSLCPTDQCPSGVRYESGTSMSAPFVAGLANHVRGLRPEWPASRVHNHIVNVARVHGRDVLLAGGDPWVLSPSGVHVIDAPATLQYVDAAFTCEDKDNDGFGSADSRGGVGLECASATPDCDDSDADVFPGTSEVCNGIDDNCDGRVDENGICLACAEPGRPIGSACGECGDGVNACSESGLFCRGAYAVPRNAFSDLDGDGFGDADAPSEVCPDSPGYVMNDEDCDDEDATVSPSAIEIPGDGIDNDCDGVSAPANNDGGGSVGSDNTCSTEWTQTCLGDSRATCRMVYPGTSVPCAPSDRRVCSLYWVPSANCRTRFGCSCETRSWGATVMAFCLDGGGSVCTSY